MHLNSYNGLNTPQFSAQKENMVNEKQMFWLLLLLLLFPLINEREHNEINPVRDYYALCSFMSAKFIWEGLSVRSLEDELKVHILSCFIP